MAALEPYTSTYSDVDGSIMDADDLVNEFWRVAYYLDLWGGSIDAIGQETRYDTYVEVVEGELAEILPQRGLIQRLEVGAGVETFTVKINEHATGAPYRVYLTIRCANKDTRFSLSVPSGQTHVFGINRTSYMPSQVLGDGWYNATIIITYSQNTGVMVQVNAANPEEEEVTFDDMQQLVPY